MDKTNTLTFEVVSPDKLLLSRAVSMVTVPGCEGDLGVLAGHAPFVVALRPGVIEVYENDIVTDRLFVTGGVAEINQSSCTVLADDALPVVSLNRQVVEQEVKNILQDIANAKSEEEKTKLEQILLATQEKLAIVS